MSLKEGFAEIKRRLSGNATTDRLRDSCVAKIKSGELDGRAEVIKAHILEAEPDIGDRVDDLTRDILKSALGEMGAAAADTPASDTQGETTPVLKAEGVPSAGTDLPTIEQLQTGVAEIRKSFAGFQDTLAEAVQNQHLLGSGIGLLLEAFETSTADLGVLKSDLGNYLNSVPAGDRPTERATPAAKPSDRLSPEEQRVIQKGIYDGRFGSLEVGTYEAGGRTRDALSEPMREYLAEKAAS